MLLKRKLKLISIILTFIFINGCNNNIYLKEKIFLSKNIPLLKVDNQINWIVILPGMGCDGCIQEGEYFMKSQIDNMKIYFVLTNISSLKVLEQKTGIDLTKHVNVYIDKESLFNIPSDNSIYPCVIYIKNGNIVSHEFQCPSNGMAFRKLTDAALLK